MEIGKYVRVGGVGEEVVVGTRKGLDGYQGSDFYANNCQISSLSEEVCLRNGCWEKNLPKWMLGGGKVIIGELVVVEFWSFGKVSEFWHSFGLLGFSFGQRFEVSVLVIGPNETGKTGKTGEIGDTGDTGDTGETGDIGETVM
ncbi:hypothetical protein C2G38_2177899 [Gigaspora rosea]|uniref:Uncharacterized protein n=1 Tax=Gigaspora rosea TaxID=44941 RepID=A0A397VGP5_9GLOM|nr:hypothetical protein C2G38_2177899 [Gigaspora rosea]